MWTVSYFWQYDCAVTVKAITDIGVKILQPPVLILHSVCTVDQGGPYDNKKPPKRSQSFC